jgi:chorismate mutase
MAFMKRIVGSVVAGLLLLGVVVAPASARVEHRAGLGQLTDLVVDRIEVGDQVAASKYGTDKPIDDPAREQVVLDQARTSALALGLDPDETVAFFRDQIEASKVVQRGLIAQWTAHPDQAPTTRPDLNEIRQTLDKLTTALLQELLHTTTTRHAGAPCAVDLTTSSLTAGIHHHLDKLHSQALQTAVPHICT